MPDQFQRKLYSLFDELQSTILEAFPLQAYIHLHITIGRPTEKPSDSLVERSEKKAFKKEIVLYNVKKAADILNAAERTVYNMCKDGRLVREMGTKRPKFTEESLTAAAPLLRNYAKKGRYR